MLTVWRATETLIHGREECKIVQLLFGNILAIPYKFNIQLTSSIEIPLPDISPSEWKLRFKQKRWSKCLQQLTYNCQNLETVQVSLNWRMDKLDCSISVWWNNSNEKGKEQNPKHATRYNWISNAFCLTKEAIIKSLNDFTEMTFLQRQNCRDRKQSSGCQRWELSTELLWGVFWSN